MSMPKLVIVADDLTGAADSAARCVQAGLAAEIWLDTRNLFTDAQVVALSTDSRFVPPEEAAQRVTATLAVLAQWADITWYKKIDSTLRGNLGAELEAMLVALPEKTIVICPAFPAQQRGLVDGKLVYAGAPPRHLPTLLAQQSALAIGTVPLATVRLGRDELARVLASMRAAGRQLIVVDALADIDLETIVAATSNGDYLLCGSAGMVAPVSATCAFARSPVQVDGRVQPGPILALVGSGSEIAHAQVALVAAAGSMAVRAIGNNWYQADLVGAQSHPVGDWLLYLAPPNSSVTLEGAGARAHAARLADLAYAAVNKLHPSTLIVVGGDTAYFVLRRLGIHRLAIIEELLPGIPLARGKDHAGQTRWVVLKPGNFGDARTLLTLQHAIRVRQRET